MGWSERFPSPRPDPRCRLKDDPGRSWLVGRAFLSDDGSFPTGRGATQYPGRQLATTLSDPQDAGRETVPFFCPRHPPTNTPSRMVVPTGPGGESHPGHRRGGTPVNIFPTPPVGPLDVSLPQFSHFFPAPDCMPTRHLSHLSH